MSESVRVSMGDSAETRCSILITKNGFHNFTTAVKSVKDVEALTTAPAPRNPL